MMMRRLPLTVRLSLYAGLILVSFSVIASQIFLRWSGLIDQIDYPFYQWFGYAWYYWGAGRYVRIQLVVSGIAGALPAVLFYSGLYARRSGLGSLRNTYWQPRMDQREWGQATPMPAPPIIGASRNFGEARFATDDEMLDRWTAPREPHGALVVGELYNPLLLEGPYKRLDMRTWGPGGAAPLLYDDGMSDSGHSVRVGGSGSGKTQSLIPSLRSTWRGPLVVLDPKQRLAPALAEARRRMGRRVVIVDPMYAKAGGQNILSFLDTKSPLLEPRIDDIVEWACGETPEHGGGDNSKFFTGAAKDIVRCLVNHIVCDTTGDPAIRTLGTARSMICSPGTVFRKYLEGIYESSPSPRASQLASLVCSEDNDTFRSIHYTVHRITAWLSTEAWADLVCGDAYAASDLVDNNTDIFLSIPFQSLSSEPAVARCILGSIFNAVFQRAGPNSMPALFALDEIAALRQFEPLKTGWTMGRELGVRMHLMYQANGQITSQWGAGGKSILRNGAGWLAYSSVKDPEDAKELEDTIGSYPVVTVSESMQTSRQGTPMSIQSRSRGNTVTFAEMGIPRLRHADIMTMRTDAQIVFAGGIRPMICGLPLDYRRRAREKARLRVA